MMPSTEFKSDCAELSVRASYHSDIHETEAFLDLFAADGAIIRAGEPFKGRDAMRRLMDRRDRRRITRHLLSPVVVERTGSATAKGLCYFTLFEARDADGAAPPYQLASPTAVGEYHDAYMLTEAGWRLRERNIISIFREGAGK